MRKSLLFLVLLAVIAMAIQLVFRPIDFGSRPAVVGSAMAQIGTVRDLLKRYEKLNGSLPAKLEDMRTLAESVGGVAALQYTSELARKPVSQGWLYFRDGLQSPLGLVVIVAPDVFTARNCEIASFGKTGHRVVLLRTGEVKVILDSDLPSSR